MLSKRESEVMNAVYALCHEKGIGLICPAELLAQLPPRRNYTEEELEKILSALTLDDYFELLSSERKGEKMYVISLRANGYAYKLGWAITSAVIAFLVGVILKWIF